MTTVTREHKAGLELAKKELGEFSIEAKAAADYCLGPLIAQASAAPEQEPVAWKCRERVYRTSLGMVWTDKLEFVKPDPDHLEVKDVVALYTHADPSEVERLRAECLRHKESAGFWGRCSARTQQKLEIAEQKLAEAQALVRAYDQPIRVAIKMLERTLSPTAMEIALELKRCLGDSCDLLSANAQPAEVKS